MAQLSVTVTGSSQRSCRDKAMLIASRYFEAGRPLQVVREDAVAVITKANTGAIMDARFEVDFVIEEQS